MRNFYKNQRNLILNSIKSSPLNNFCTIREQDSGLHFLMTVNTTLSKAEISERADKLGIRIGFLSDFYFNTCSINDTIITDCPKHTLVINYSGIEPEKIPHALKLLNKCII